MTYFRRSLSATIRCLLPWYALLTDVVFPQLLNPRISNTNTLTLKVYFSLPFFRIYFLSFHVQIFVVCINLPYSSIIMGAIYFLIVKRLVWSVWGWIQPRYLTVSPPWLYISMGLFAQNAHKSITWLSISCRECNTYMNTVGEYWEQS